jgi:ribonucleotide monophosphatase NagD (HAD superfamily)
MNLQPDQVAMIGDDIYTDIAGAQNAGMTGILVRTGKFREEILQNSLIKPDVIIDSIAALMEVV